jgi:sugar phosphate isomerase/epimerase
VSTSRRATRREFLNRSLAVGTASAVAVHLAASRAAPAPERPDAGGWQIGCYTRPWGDCDYRVALDAIAEAGFGHVGLMTTKSKTRLVISAATPIEEAQQIGEEARRRGLRIPSVYGGGIPVEQSLEAGIDALKRLIDNCAVAGAASLLMGGTGDQALYDRYYKAIAECCPYAAEKAVAITIKPHGGLNATGAQCRKAIERVGHANFSLWYDPGNIYYYSDGTLDPVAEAASVDGLVTGLCVKDYTHPKQVMLTPGTGQVNFAAVLARLRQGGFTHGPLVIETLAAGELPKVLEEAKKARRFVEGLVAAPRGE